MSRSFFLGLMLLVLLVGFTRPLGSYDTGLHLRLGEEILSTLTVTDVDFHSFTANGKPYAAHEWLSECLMALVHRAFGVPGLCVLPGVLVALTALLIHRSLRADGWGGFAALLFAAALASFHSSARPHVLAWLFLGILLFLQRRGSTWGLLGLLWVWANCHASVPLGALLAAFGFLERFVACRKIESLGWATAMLLVPIFNPYGIRIYIHVMEIRPGVVWVEEWQHWPMSHPGFWIWAVYALTLVTGLLLSRWRSPFDWTRALALLALGSTASRQAPVAALLLVPLQAEVWSGPLERLSARMPSLLPGLLAAGVAAGSIFLVRHDGAGRVGVNEKRLPVASTRFLLEKEVQGPLFNDYNFGGYLLWKAWPQHKVFLDGRTDLYWPQPLQDARIVHFARPGWQAILDRYAIACVMIQKNRPLAASLTKDPGWDLIYEDPLAVLFLRKGTPIPLS